MPINTAPKYVTYTNANLALANFLEVCLDGTDLGAADLYDTIVVSHDLTVAGTMRLSCQEVKGLNVPNPYQQNQLIGLVGQLRIISRQNQL